MYFKKFETWDDFDIWLYEWIARILLIFSSILMFGLIIFFILMVFGGIFIMTAGFLFGF